MQETTTYSFEIEKKHIHPDKKRREKSHSFVVQFAADIIWNFILLMDTFDLNQDKIWGHNKGHWLKSRKES